MRFNGNAKIDTPTMDRLATEGARFEHFYVSPMCGPTRASLLTGRYDLRTGVSWVSHGLETLRLNEVTLGDAFKAGGYATGAFGKWHNGEHGPYHPNQRGFDEFFGFCRGAWENYFDAKIERNGEPVETKGYITDVLTDQAISFIEKNKNRPFFCYLPYNAPHHPFQLPPAYYEKYKQRGFSEKVAAVYGMVENIDDNMARIFKKLDDLNLSNDTIVVFLSDNGPSMPTSKKSKDWRYNGGMKGRKAQVDEGGVRVPLFIRWPGHIKAGLQIKPITAHMDLFPTLLELTGVAMPKTLPLDGRSLVPLLMGASDDGKDSWPERMIFTHQNVFGDNLIFPGGVRAQGFRLVNHGKKYELYDMINDPGQEKNVISEHPELSARLGKAYENWYREVTAAGTSAPPAPVGFEGTDEVALQAEDAKLQGGLKFRGRFGWAHDVVIDWKNTQATVEWDLDVLRAGSYEITLMYSCPERYTGAEIEVEAAGQQLRRKVVKAYDPQPATTAELDHNRLATSGPVWFRTYAPLDFGKMRLEKGLTKLRVRALEIPGEEAFVLKEARIRYIKK